MYLAPVWKMFALLREKGGKGKKRKGKEKKKGGKEKQVYVQLCVLILVTSAQ